MSIKNLEKSKESNKTNCDCFHWFFVRTTLIFLETTCGRMKSQTAWTSRSILRHQSVSKCEKSRNPLGFRKSVHSWLQGMRCLVYQKIGNYTDSLGLFLLDVNWDVCCKHVPKVRLRVGGNHAVDQPQIVTWLWIPVYVNFLFSKISFMKAKLLITQWG